jgi:sterol desaturase/sphingolipid hydroxylase (fatty acid hydroxylase superfamily)
MHESPLVFLSFCACFFAILEAHLAKKRGKPVYSQTQTELAIGLAIGQLLVSLTVLAFLQKLIHIPDEKKLFVLPDHFGWGLLGFFVIDFLAYVNHLLSHKISLFWADHAVHHANTEYNVATHLAHGWTGFVSATLAVSLLIGFFGNTERVVFTYFAVAFLVQTLAHTQLIHKLGWLEEFLVTPSHHRVHHSLERATHDNNYGMVFIVWDKFFGTFQPEGEVQMTTFGLDSSPSLNAPLWQHASFGWCNYCKNWCSATSKRSKSL